MANNINDNLNIVNGNVDAFNGNLYLVSNNLGGLTKQQIAVKISILLFFGQKTANYCVFSIRCIMVPLKGHTTLFQL